MKHCIDQTTGIAILIDYRNINRAFMTWQAGFRQIFKRLVRIDLRPNGPSMVSTQQIINRNITKSRISKIERPITISKTPSFNFVMHAFK